MHPALTNPTYRYPRSRPGWGKRLCPCGGPCITLIWLGVASVFDIERRPCRRIFGPKEERP